MTRKLNATVENDDQLVVLGHELQHALEFADADVRDEEGQRALGRRIGWAHGGGCGYETQDAIDAGSAVRVELRTAPRSRR